MSMSKTVCHEILTEDPGKRKLNVRLVRRSPNEEQKVGRSEICADTWKLQARMTYSAVPSSLKMKHDAYCMPRKQKDRVQTSEAQTQLPRKKLVPCLRKQI
jgi:hypothetical protein